MSDKSADEPVSEQVRAFREDLEHLEEFAARRSLEGELRLAAPQAVVAENELAQLVHDWSVRWVEGHDEADRASCFGGDLARTVVEGGSASFSELLIKAREPRVVLVCALCLKTWSEGHDCGGDQDGR